MKKFWLSTELRWRKGTGLTKVRIDGVRVDIAPEYTPKFIARSILARAYEGPERTIAKKVLQPGMSVVEIGAGLGIVGLLAARLTKGGKVVSYEANPHLEGAIRHNYSLNAAAPKLNMRAVTLDGLPVTFYRNDNIVSSSLLEREIDSKPITVDSVRFDDVIAENKPDVLIMDVEGAEVSLLGQSDLSGIQHIIVELHPHIVGEDAINNLVREINTKGFSIAEQLRGAVHFRRQA